MRFWKYVKGINYKNDNEDKLENYNKTNSELNDEQNNNLEKSSEINKQTSEDTKNSTTTCDDEFQEKDIPSESSEQDETLNDMQETMNNESKSLETGSQDMPESFNNSQEYGDNSQTPSQEKDIPSESSEQDETLNDMQETMNDENKSMKSSSISQESSEVLDNSKEETPNSQNQLSESVDEQACADTEVSESGIQDDFEVEEFDQNIKEKNNFENADKSFSDEVSETEQELSSEQSNQLDEKDLNDEENKKRLELLKKLRDKIAEHAKEKEKQEKLERHKNHADHKEVEESLEEDYHLSEETNQFIDKLKDLPSFENRDKGPGYAIDTGCYTDVPESIIRTLITKFLNQRFCKRDTDLNVRSNSLEKSRGFYKWEVKDVVIHLETEQLTKIPNDKYGYQYANGKNENVPLSFYFDMSGSMSNYTNMLAVIAIELLKKGVKVLIGFNERVNIQIDSINKNISVEELANFLEKYQYEEKMQSKIKHKKINRNIDNYLIEAKAEKCCIFSDFDPIDEVINLSHKTQVYWFCFENEYHIGNISNYNGFIYPVHDIDTIASGLVKVNENRFETLLYVENPKKLRK